MILTFIPIDVDQKRKRKERAEDQKKQTNLDRELGELEREKLKVY